MTLLKSRSFYLLVCILFILLPASLYAASSTSDKWVDPTTGMEFIWVAGGCFQMGDDFGVGWRREHPLHNVCVDGFYMGKYEVTQGQYDEVTGDTPSDNHSFFTNTEDYPVIRVSWSDTQHFIKELNKRGSMSYRLPTEAEWEFAARGRGEKQKFAGGEKIDELAWFRQNSDDSYDPEKWDKKDEKDNPINYFTTEEYRENSKNSLVHTVGTKRPNSIGIYDMSGNVWEWCNDWFEEEYYNNSPKNNPKGPGNGSARILRGGSWYSMDWDTRCSVRFHHAPDFKNSSVGFRLILPGPKKDLAAN